MIKTKYRVTTVLYLTGDLGATALAFFTAWYLRFEATLIPLQKDVPAFGPYLALLPLIAVLWPVVFYFHGLYQSKRGQSRVDEAFALVLAILLSILILNTILTFVRPPREPGSLEYFTYSRVFLGLFFGVNLVLVGATRFTLRGLLRSLRRRGYNLQRILVVGAGKLGQELVQKLLAHREMGFEVVGFADDDPGKANSAFFGVPVLGSLKDLSELLQKREIDQVILALPVEAHRKTLRILEQVGNECVEVRLVPDILQYTTLRATLEDFDGLPMINLSQVPLRGWNTLVKRGMDLGLSSLFMLLLVPFLPWVALLIWLEDRGPIFYRQVRMGLDGRSFVMYKFRSMRVDAESSTGPIWASKNDPRRTRVGSFLRATSLDELPQLWNVFRGDMSIVGPRPERPAFVKEFRHKLPNYMRRHRVKAGITGWAQVHGWRGNTSIRKRLQYDLYYIENWTVGLDLKILWLTLRGLRKNAY